MSNIDHPGKIKAPAKSSHDAMIIAAYSVPALAIAASLRGFSGSPDRYPIGLELAAAIP